MALLLLYPPNGPRPARATSTLPGRTYVVIKASGAQTNGQLAAMERTYPPGLEVPIHVHAGEDEKFYVLEDRLQGWL